MYGEHFMVVRTLAIPDGWRFENNRISPAWVSLGDLKGETVCEERVISCVNITSYSLDIPLPG